MPILFLLLLLILGCQQSPPAPAEPVPSATPADSQVGKAAPRLQGTDQDGQPIDLGQLYDQGPVLVFFYPKAGTPGCTAQACSLRDAYEQLQEAGLTVVGVSTDSVDAQQKFKTTQKLPYTLLADPEGKVLEAFSVRKLAGLANREAFLIREGQVVWHDGSASTGKQAEDVLKVMEGWK